jgi:hypothetical protein
VAFLTLLRRLPAGSVVTEGSQITHFAHAVFPSTCTELVKVTGGEPADIA